MDKLSSLICTTDFEKEAYQILPKTTRDFHKSGALHEHTLKENIEAIQRFYIRPRFFVDVSRSDLRTRILGNEVSVPFGVAPMGFQKLAHPEGERGTAKAAAQIGAAFTLSTYTTTSPEDISKENGLQFFQLYVFKDREFSAAMVHRAEKCGFKAIVITLDVPFHGIRYTDRRNGFTPPFEQCEALKLKKNEAQNAMSEGNFDFFTYINGLVESSLTLEVISWLKRITSLPIILKGIMTAEDAIKGVDAGASAIWVSNHGGRQIDGISPTIEALPEIIEAVGHRCEVYVDGGFRTGSDIFKALAIGANMVFIGRPLLWGLTVRGSEGAFKILQILKNELQNVMALSGYPNVKDISRKAVKRKETVSNL